SRLPNLETHESHITAELNPECRLVLVDRRISDGSARRLLLGVCRLAVSVLATIDGDGRAQVIAALGPLGYFSNLLDTRPALPSQARFLAVLADCEVFNRPRCRKLRSCGR
ncbi:hypothetical protein, partial [Mesorhizobium sp. B4-1-3]|uniref:hypothetical protein n=1 Tax=Mesorhizobium sp. B4-1-3 TaxID=2589889 RepID=UPI001AED32CB